MKTDREKHRERYVPAVTRIHMDFHVYINHITNVHVLRVVCREIRLFTVFLNPSYCTADVSIRTVDQLLRYHAYYNMRQ